MKNIKANLFKFVSVISFSVFLLFYFGTNVKAELVDSVEDVELFEDNSSSDSVDLVNTSPDSEIFKEEGDVESSVDNQENESELGNETDQASTETTIINDKNLDPDPEIIEESFVKTPITNDDEQNNDALSDNKDNEILEDVEKVMLEEVIDLHDGEMNLTNDPYSDTYIIQEVDGNLFLVNERTNEPRKDNAWFYYDGKYYFPNSKGILYRNRIITFGENIAYFMDNSGARSVGGPASFNDINYDFNVAKTLGENWTVYRIDPKTSKVILGKDKTDWLDLPNDSDPSKSDHFFMNELGSTYKNRWISFGAERRHYMDKHGKALLGVQNLNGNKYLLDDTDRGCLRIDNAWVSYNGRDYFPNSEGKLYNNQLITFGPQNVYYMDLNGAKSTGEKASYKGKEYNFNIVKTVGKNWTVYRIDPKTSKIVLGKDKTGWLDLPNDSDPSKSDHFFMNELGSTYKNRWISFGAERRHYMDQHGKALLGVQNLNGNKYLLDDTDRGLLRIDNAWVSYDGKDYFPNSEGKLYYNRFITFGPKVSYYMKNDGSKAKGITPALGTVYNLDSNTGALIKKADWYEYNGQQYFSNANGIPYRNQFITFGPKVSYYMKSDGAKAKGVTPALGTVYNLDSNTGALIKKAGWYEYNGQKYFSNTNGIPYRNQFITFGPNTAYYMNKTGAAVKNKTLVINTVPYTFNSNGLVSNGYKGWQSLNGNLYYFNGIISPATGWFYVGSDRYHAATTGILDKGLKRISGNLYYFDTRNSAPYPKMVKNERISLGHDSYFFDNYGIGRVATDWTYSNYRYDKGVLYIYNSYGNMINSRYVGSNHAFISLQHQKMFTFYNNKLAHWTHIITGAPVTPTPTGNFNIYAIQRATHLVGADYNVYVEYWIPFYGAYGIHDARWQNESDFTNNKQYLVTGSHGCVNIPKSQMPIAAQYLRVGTPVTIRY